MIIESSGISAYLPNSSREIEVRTQRGLLAFKATVGQILRMAEKSIISAQIDKKGFLRYAILLVAVRLARQLAGVDAHVGKRLPVAEDNYTIARIQSDGGCYYQHNFKVCAAYARV